MEWNTQSDQTRISVPCRGWPEVHTRQMCAYISTWRYLLAALLQLRGKHQKPLCRFSPGVTLQGQPCPVQRELQLPTKKEQTVSTHSQEQGRRQIFSSARSSWHTQPVSGVALHSWAPHFMGWKHGGKEEAEHLSQRGFHAVHFQALCPLGFTCFLPDFSTQYFRLKFQKWCSLLLTTYLPAA